MPRGAAQRGFGFEAEAIVRILTASDGEEVFRALETLGLVDQIDSDRIMRDLHSLGVDITGVIIDIQKPLNFVIFALRILINFLEDHRFHPVPHSDEPLLNAQTALSLIEFLESTLTRRLPALNKRLDELDQERATLFQRSVDDQTEVTSLFPFNLPEF